MLLPAGELTADVNPIDSGVQSRDHQKEVDLNQIEPSRAVPIGWSPPCITLFITRDPHFLIDVGLVWPTRPSRFPSFPHFSSFQLPQPAILPSRHNFGQPLFCYCLIYLFLLAYFSFFTPTTPPSSLQASPPFYAVPRLPFTCKSRHLLIGRAPFILTLFNIVHPLHHTFATHILQLLH